MGRVCMGRVGYGPSLSWAEFVMGRDVLLPFNCLTISASVGSTSVWNKAALIVRSSREKFTPT